MENCLFWNVILPEHAFVLQVSAVLLDPLQYFPPFIVRGLLQLLDLDLDPDPQVLEQLPQGPQDPQLPLTGPVKLSIK